MKLLSHVPTNRRLIIAAIIALPALVLVIQLVRALTSTGVITNSSSTGATQASTMHHLVRTSDGTQHSFVQVGTQTATCGGQSLSGLLYFQSTDNGATWTCTSQLSSDTTNQMFASAVKDSSDNVYVVYSTVSTTESASYDVFYRKLTKGTGANWTVESAQTVLDSSSTTGYSYSVME